MGSENKNARIQHEVFALGTLQHRDINKYLLYVTRHLPLDKIPKKQDSGYVNPWCDLAG